MKSMDRILAVMQGNPVDRLPFTLTLSLYGARLTSCPLQEYYTNPTAYADGQSAVAELCKPDIIFAPFFLAAEGQAFGSEVKFLEKESPNIRKPVISAADDIEKLEIPDINSNPQLIYFRESIRLLVKRFKKEIPIAGVLTTPAGLPSIIMGMEKWIDTLLFNKEQAKVMLEKTTEFFINWANTLLQDGADFLIMPTIFCNPDIVSLKIAEDHILEVLYNAFKEINGPLVMHNTGAPMAKFLHLYNKLPNIVAFVIDPTDSFQTAREKIDKKKLLLGNIDGPNLAQYNPEDVRIICEKILTDRIDDKCFILASSGPDVAFDTPLENITTVFESVSNFKREN